jgi:hypothetical protein
VPLTVVKHLEKPSDEKLLDDKKIFNKGADNSKRMTKTTKKTKNKSKRTKKIECSKQKSLR